jgi:hypothetical protein
MKKVTKATAEVKAPNGNGQHPQPAEQEQPKEQPLPKLPPAATHDEPYNPSLERTPRWKPIVALMGVRHVAGRFTYRGSIEQDGTTICRYRLVANHRYINVSILPKAKRGEQEQIRCWMWHDEAGAYFEIPQAVAVESLIR